jgi:hypothetical protein
MCANDLTRLACKRSEQAGGEREKEKEREIEREREGEGGRERERERERERGVMDISGAELSQHF